MCPGDLTSASILAAITRPPNIGRYHKTTKYAIVTYDLAVSLKTYCIQAVQAPKFDNLIIFLGNFHIELTFFGAVGTYIADSGVEH